MKTNKRKQNWFLYTGAVITAFMVALIVLGYFWTPYEPNAMDAAAQAAPPSLAHSMGTDNFGRDIFSRVLQGAGTTFFIALCVVLIGTVAGVLIGALTGYFGGWGDEVLMRLCDSITAFPSILLALVVIAVLGPGKWNVIWVLGILFIPSFARVVRGEYARCKNLNYVKSARLMGAGPLRIMIRHILPNTFPVLLPAISIGFNNGKSWPDAFGCAGLFAARPALVCPVCGLCYCPADPGLQPAQRGPAAATPQMRGRRYVRRD